MVAFVETTYTVNESEGQVEICVSVNHALDDILEFTVLVEAFNNESSIYITSNAEIASELPLHLTL